MASIAPPRPIAAEWLGVPLEDLTEDATYGLPERDLDSMGGYEQHGAQPVAATVPSPRGAIAAVLIAVAALGAARLSGGTHELPSDEKKKTPTPPERQPLQP